MIKLLLVVLASLSIIACESRQDVVNDIDRLRNERTSLEHEVKGYNTVIEQRLKSSSKN